MQALVVKVEYFFSKYKHIEEIWGLVIGKSERIFGNIIIQLSLP